MGNSFADCIQRVGDLPISVQLVTENIVDYQTLYRQHLTGLTERCLIALDQCMCVRTFTGKTAVLCKHRNDPGQKIGTGFICKVLISGFFKCLLDHTGRGRLSIGSGHYRNLHPT